MHADHPHRRLGVHQQLGQRVELTLQHRLKLSAWGVVLLQREGIDEEHGGVSADGGVGGVQVAPQQRLVPVVMRRIGGW